MCDCEEEASTDQIMHACSVLDMAVCFNAVSLVWYIIYSILVL